MRRADVLLMVAVLAMLGGLSLPLLPIGYAALPNRFAAVDGGRLYRGGVPDSPAALRRLRDEHHVRSVVDLTDDASKKHGFNEGRCAADLGIVYRNIPMPGNGQGDFASLDEAADAIAAAASQPAYFHCSAGKMRSSAAQFAWRVRRCGWSAEKALKELTDEFAMDPSENAALFEHLRKYAVSRAVARR